MSQQNLINADEIPVTANNTFTEADPGAGRGDGQVSVCESTAATNLSALGGTPVLRRNFTSQYQYQPGESPDPSDPLKDLPSEYTAAIQFTDPDAAKQAFDTYTSWVDGCLNQLEGLGYRVLNQEPQEWYEAPTETGRGKFTQIVYREPKAKDQDAGFFESIGLTLVEDRLMITVSLVYGQDHIVIMAPTPDANEPSLDPHPQFALIRLAAEHLAR